MLLNKIEAKAKSISDLLSNQKYTIDYYQREYKWTKKQITELIEDLEAKFLDSYEEDHSRIDVEKYRHYFLGSIIVSNRDGKQLIIDGQQRLTSITLLLIYLLNLQQEHLGKVENDVSTLILSKKFGKESFNLDIAERVECLNALFHGNRSFDVNGSSESVHNIMARYDDIDKNFPVTLKGDPLQGRPLLHFIDWLQYNVDLVEITTYSDEEAYTIFETMNDRGLSLTPTDMLKGYLLANITDPEERVNASNLWKNRLLDLTKQGKEEDADFFKAWLRAKYADTIREGKKGAENKDFEIIGTTFHKWVHDESREIGLKGSDDFQDFILKHFNRFSDQYMRIRNAAQTFTKDLEYVFYNAHNNFTLQYPLILAPLTIKDDQETIDRKIRLVSGYVDIFIARRAVNFRTLDYSAIVYTMFNLMKEIRELDVPSLASRLKTKVDEMSETFEGGVPYFRLNQRSKRFVHHILARITYHIEAQSHMETDFVRYVSRELKKPFEIEHIWSNKYEQHADEFANEEAFSIHRSRIGGLLLLPKDINQSLGDTPYSEKQRHYIKQNLLAQTLCQECYTRNPSFLAYKNQRELPFRAHDTFNKADLDTRQKLYERLCKEIWSTERFDKELV